MLKFTLLQAYGNRHCLFFLEGSTLSSSVISIAFLNGISSSTASDSSFYCTVQKSQ